MQTRTITVDYARPRGYDVGYRAENNFTLLALPIPAELEGADSYRVYFESTVGEYLQTELLIPADGYVTVKITSDIVPEPGNMAAQLVAFADGEIVGYAPMITGSAKVSIPDGTERLSHSLAAEIALNTAARHSHANKAVLDKFAESDGQPTYDGKALGGGASSAEDVSYTNASLEGVSNVKGALDAIAETQQTHDDDILALGDAVDALDKKAHSHTNKSILDLLSAADGILTYDGKSVDGSEDFIIQMTVSDAGELVSCDTTFEQVDAAYKAGKNPVVVVNPENDSSEGGTYLPLLSVIVGEGYIFSCFYDGQTFTVEAYPDEWSYTEDNLTATDIGYTNSSMPNVGAALDSLIAQTHTHSNKAVLDLLSDADGKLQYDGSDVGLKGDKGSDGKDGSNGKDGTNGITPTIGTNGNWYLGDTDTGKPSRGEKGEKGSDASVTKANIVAALGYTPKAVSAQVATGTEITLADNTEYRLTDVTTLTLTYPTGNFECWLKLSFAASGSITVTLPTGTKYIGNAPSFANGEVWEMSIKDGVVIAQKVGEGT